MFTKFILLSALVLVFCLGLTGAVFACDYDQPHATMGKNLLTMNTDGADLDFDYSPRTSRHGMASAVNLRNDEENIDFDYSPRTGGLGPASVATTNGDEENIDFDYSPRMDSHSRSLSSVNFEGENIEFDYSPRPLMCEGSSC